MAFYLKRKTGEWCGSDGEPSFEKDRYGYSSENEASLAMGRFGSGGVTFDLGTVEIVEE